MTVALDRGAQPCDRGDRGSGNRDDWHDQKEQTERVSREGPCGEKESLGEEKCRYNEIKYTGVPTLLSCNNLAWPTIVSTITCAQYSTILSASAHPLSSSWLSKVLPPFRPCLAVGTKYLHHAAVKSGNERVENPFSYQNIKWLHYALTLLSPLKQYTIAVCFSIAAGTSKDTISWFPRVKKHVVLPKSLLVVILAAINTVTALCLTVAVAAYWLVMVLASTKLI